jgi:N-acetylneuraminic acid mutarotase
MSGVLSDTLYMPFTGIPTPTGLKHVYDTTNQIVTLSWNAANASLIQGYYVYRQHKDSNAVRLNSTPIPDTLYSDSLKDGGPPYNGTYFYYITAVNKTNTEGPESILDSIFIKGNCQGWCPKNPITPRKEHHCLTTGNTLYCTGGVDNAGPMQFLMKYNPDSDTWENLAPIPKPRSGASACAANDKLYYYAGEDFAWMYSNYEYTPSDDSWNKKLKFCVVGKYMASTVLNDTIYTIGGTKEEEVITDSVYLYDPVNDIWSNSAPMQTARTKLTACSVNGKIYAIGGDNGSNVLATVEEYNPDTDTWTTKSLMPTARMSLACCVLNNKIYVLGGFDRINVLSTVEMYDPITDTWTAKSPMPTARQGLSAAVVNGKILAVGGWNGSEIIGVVEEYTPCDE